MTRRSSRREVQAADKARDETRGGDRNWNQTAPSLVCCAMAIASRPGKDRGGVIIDRSKWLDHVSIGRAVEPALSGATRPTGAFRLRVRLRRG